MYSPTSVTNSDFNNFVKYAVGFNTLFDSIDAVLTSPSINDNYPRHNLFELEKGTRYAVSMALAGYPKDNLKVEWKDSLLVVTGEPSPDDKQKDAIYNGIAQRKFTKTFALGEYIEVDHVTFKDGLLVIELKRVVPEEERMKVVPIS